MFTDTRLKEEEKQAEKLLVEMRQISDTALTLKSKVEEVSQEKEQTVTAYQVRK